jgi:hypothetical protein
MYNRTAQNIPMAKLIRLPNVVVTRSVDEVRQRSPIKKTTKAIKKVWMYII